MCAFILVFQRKNFGMGRLLFFPGRGRKETKHQILSLLVYHLTFTIQACKIQLHILVGKSDPRVMACRP